MPPAFEIQLGDTGIFASKIKAPDVHKAYDEFKKKNVNIISEISNTPEGKPHFFFKDPYNNIFEVEEFFYLVLLFLVSLKIAGSGDQNLYFFLIP